VTPMSEGGTQMLAACEACGAIYGTPLVLAEGASLNLLEGGRVGPCPNCGATSRIPPGLYEWEGADRGNRGGQMAVRSPRRRA
jgi:hypothetical protein